jgi:hypothetical protein
MLDAGRYKANFTRGGLMVPESRVVADLLLADADADHWRQAIQIDNVLAKRSVSTAVTKARLIRARLKTLPPSLWNVIRDGSKPAATHAVLAGAVNFLAIVRRFPGPGRPRPVSALRVGAQAPALGHLCRRLPFPRPGRYPRRHRPRQ